MKFDDILTDIGEFGPYQIRVFLMVGLIGIPVGFNQMAQVFYASKMDHWCAVDEWTSQLDNCGDPRADTRTYLDCIHTLRNASIPQEEDDDGNLMFAECFKYDMSDMNYSNRTDSYGYQDYIDQTVEPIGCDEGWVYDRSENPRTIISDFNLVCDKRSAPDIAQSIFFAGVLVGSFGYGSLSDIIGRYYTYYIAVAMLSVFSLVTAFSPKFGVYILFRFFVAAANLGSFLVAFVIGTELVGPSKRVIANCIIQCFFAIGYMLLAVVAFFVRDWRKLQLTIVAPTFLFFLTIPFVPESPRWLISKQKYDQAAKIICRAAKGNNKDGKLPENFMEEIKKTEELNCNEDSAIKTVTFIDLFRTPNLRKSTLNFMYNWHLPLILQSIEPHMDHSDIITETSFRNLSVSWETSKQLLSKWLESLQGSIVTPLDLDTVLLQCLATVFFLISVRFINSLVYYGLSLSTSDLGSNIYVAFFISGAVEIPAYFVGIPMMESRLGRRYSTSICELLGGVSCLLTILLPPGVGKTVIAMIGKFGISASFSLVYIYAAEVIPTPLRSVGVGLCSTAARVGGILSPLILLLDEIWKPLPLIIFGSSAIIGGLLVLLLPESRGKMLPETIEEGEIFSTRSKQSRMSAYKGISDKEEAV